MATNYIRLLQAPARIHDVIFEVAIDNVCSEMGETLASLDTFYVTN